MANSVTNLDLLSVGQSGKENTVNALVDSMSPAALYGRRADTTMALTWGFYGGNLLVNKIIYPIVNGTVALTNNADNYLEMSNSDGSLTINTTGFATTGKTKLYKITTLNSLVTSYTDYRAFLRIAETDTYTLPIASTTVLGGVMVDGTTITIDVNGKISSVSSYTLPIASTTVLGGVKVDGTSITADSNGVISAVGSTSLATSKVFDIVSKSGLQVVIKGGKMCNLAGSGFYNSNTPYLTVSDKTITISANTNGYICFDSRNAGDISFSASPWVSNFKPIYYCVTNANSITVLDDIRDSFVHFGGAKSIKELIQSTWSVSSSYSFSANFNQSNTSGVSWNIFPRRIQLRCTTAEFGYAVGQCTYAVLNEPSVVIQSGGFAIILTQATVPSVMNRTTLGTVSQITIANWEILLVIESAL